jgi:hypothetical protein
MQRCFTYLRRTMKTSEILNAAADEIEVRGWSDYTTNNSWGFGSATGPVCLEGGILAAMGFKMEQPWGEAILSKEFEALETCPAYEAVMEYLGREKGQPLWSWNDSVSRTKEEVFEVLRAAAVVEAAKEAALDKTLVSVVD